MRVMSNTQAIQVPGEWKTHREERGLLGMGVGEGLRVWAALGN